MHTQIIRFAVQEENGVVTKIGRSTLYQPRTDFKGNGGQTEVSGQAGQVNTDQEAEGMEG